MSAIPESAFIMKPASQAAGLVSETSIDCIFAMAATSTIVTSTNATSTGHISATAVISTDSIPVAFMAVSSTSYVPATSTDLVIAASTSCDTGVYEALKCV